jgi:hypothetical protein
MPARKCPGSTGRFGVERCEEEAMEKQNPATDELGRLDVFVGVWDTEGEMITGPSGPQVKFTATDTYEWMPGGHFLLHRFDAHMPAGRVQGTEIIGYSQESGDYPMHSVDSRGNVSVMHARTDGDRWTFSGECMRFSGGFRDNGMIFAGLWEIRSVDGSTWQPWMQVRLRKTA